MGALEKFLGSPKKVVIGDLEVEIVPLPVKSLKKFNRPNASDEEKQDMAIDMIVMSVNNTTKEEIESLPTSVFIKLVEEINKLNGFTDERAEKLRQLSSK